MKNNGAFRLCIWQQHFAFLFAAKKSVQLTGIVHVEDTPRWFSLIYFRGEKIGFCDGLLLLHKFNLLNFFNVTSYQAEEGVLSSFSPNIGSFLVCSICRLPLSNFTPVFNKPSTTQRDGFGVFRYSGNRRWGS